MITSSRFGNLLVGFLCATFLMLGSVYSMPLSLTLTLGFFYLLIAATIILVLLGQRLARRVAFLTEPYPGVLFGHPLAKHTIPTMIATVALAAFAMFLPIYPENFSVWESYVLSLGILSWLHIVGRMMRRLWVADGTTGHRNPSASETGTTSDDESTPEDSKYDWLWLVASVVVSIAATIALHRGLGISVWIVIAVVWALGLVMLQLFGCSRS